MSINDILEVVEVDPVTGLVMTETDKAAWTEAERCVTRAIHTISCMALMLKTSIMQQLVLVLLVCFGIVALFCFTFPFTHASMRLDAAMT